MYLMQYYVIFIYSSGYKRKWGGVVVYSHITSLFCLLVIHVSTVSAIKKLTLLLV